MMRFDSWKKFCAAFLFCAAMVVAAPAQATFTTLVSFDGTNGKYPGGALVQGADGNFYGVTASGGTSCRYEDASGCGTVFKTTLEGELTKLYSFCTLAGCADGTQPTSLILATNGKFYGTTSSGGVGGSDGCGTVFEITATGKLTTLHSFIGTDGCSAGAGLFQASNGNFYGTTPYDGSNGGGTVFEITPTGTLTTLHNFCSLANCADGRGPSGLVQAPDGNIYGTTESGGANQNAESCPNGCGTVFKISAAGKLTTLYSFCSLTNCVDGDDPDSLVGAIDGNFYGTTFYGGANCTSGDCGGGTVFEISPAGKLTTLYSFCPLANCAGGTFPNSLVQATDGNFYGTTQAGGTGPGNDGTAFEINSAGSLATLYNFCSQGGEDCTDGALPAGGLLQATNGTFYGTTSEGGASNDGTVFSLSTGLGPFVSFVRNPAKVGQEFGILGQGLTGTTNVSLNGTPASFTVRSDTLLTATVPAGATPGYVSVTTPTGTLTSNVPFYVIP